MSFTPAQGHDGTWVHQQRKTRARPWVTTSPPPQPPAFEISTRNRFAPLCETERDTVIIGDSIVRHVRATLAEDKVHTHCFPGARVLNVSAQIPAILKGDESIGAVVLHAGVNDTKLRQTETLKRDCTMHIIVSRIDEDTKGSVDFLLQTNGYCHGIKNRNCSLLIIGIFSGSILGYSMLMACTPAESERNSCRTTSPGRYAPSD
ncbi:uncharacterized protein LOC131541657 [Onychostoma macrolepis]|uniref:uncharacterized protein LOC131541657 n=1 Tax=Onychostoma macrolepis TaxID=369639 RepID=UPI002729BE29|nr:uncharacterized protein LOC131541657 [Onychostoma macrolepis]